MEHYSYVIFVGFFPRLRFSPGAVCCWFLNLMFLSKLVIYHLVHQLILCKEIHEFCYFHDCRAYIIKSGHQPGGTCMASHMIE